MKKLFTLLFIAFVSTAFAQFPDIGLAASNVEAPNGTLTQVDIYVTTDNFDNMNNITGSIIWDPTVASYSTISYFGLFNPEMSLGDFDVSDADLGIITFNWWSTFTVGPNLDIGDVIFSIEFLAIGDNGSSTPVSFSNSPVDLSWFNGFGWNGTFDGEDGSITVGGLNLTGCYDPDNWISNTSNTNGSVIHTAGVITMEGDNDFTGNGVSGVDCAGTEGNVTYCISIPNDGNVTFDWDYGSAIANATSDAFGYCLNGVATQLASANPPPFGTPFGSANIAVQAGDELCFVISSESSMLPNAPIVTITEFTGPACELPSLLATINLTSAIACNGDASGALEVTTEYGTEPFTYSWDVPGVEGSNPSGLIAGTYCVTVIDAVPDTSYVCYEITEAATLLSASSNTLPDDGTGSGMALLNVSGGQSPYTITWDTDPVQNGPIAQNLSNGVYNYTIVDALGCTITGQVTIIYVGIEEITGLQQFEFYPNPANDILNLTIQFEQNKDFTIQIMNSLGQSVMDLGTSNGTHFRNDIDLSNLNAGFYYVNVDVDGFRLTKKLIVK